MQSSGAALSGPRRSNTCRLLLLLGAPDLAAEASTLVRVPRSVKEGPLIRFVTTRGHDHTLQKLRRHPAAPPLEIVSYDRIFRARSHPRRPHVFTDLDRLAPWDLELAAVIARGLREEGVAIWNDPARVKTRFALLRALHDAGINSFGAYRLDEGRWPERYPVFLRRNAGHRFPVSELLPDRAALERRIEQALADGVPESALIAVEYCAEPAAPGLYRKFALQRAGAHWIQMLSVNDDQWLVKYGRPGFYATSEMYEEELAWVRQSPFVEALRPAFEIAGIDWGRADFGWVRGRVEVWEINTNPSIGWPTEHPHPQRLESAQEGLRQLGAALAGFAATGCGATAGRVRVDDVRLRKAWRRRNWFARSRVAP